MNENAFAALKSMVYVARQILNGGSITDDDQKIKASGLYENWAPGAFKVGDIRNANGQTWECFQEHDVAIYPDITPDGPAWGTFWRPLHGKSASTARPFVPVHGAHDTYKPGEYAIWTDGSLRECVRETAYGPDEDPTAWKSPGTETPTPNEPILAAEWPEWVQPSGAHDAYDAGDKVSHNGARWISDVSSNIWEPGVYGWTEAPEESAENAAAYAAAPAPDLDTMTVAQLKAYAAERGIDLTGKTLKADILAAIQAAEGVPT